MAKNKKNKTDKDKGKPELVGKRGYRNPEEIELHDDLKGLYLITDKDQKSLTDGIRSDGFLEDRPLMLFKGPWTGGKEVLGDGHTRLPAAIANGIKKVPVVVHETQTLQDAVSMIFGVDYRQRKRYETIHLIHLLKKILPIVSSISDAGKKPKGKLSALLGRWIGASQATVERMMSILKNTEAMAYIGKHKDEKLSILKIHDMFKDTAEGGDGPAAPEGEGEEQSKEPPVVPVAPVKSPDPVLCKDCGEPISQNRLASLPDTKLCLACKKKAEELAKCPDCFGDYSEPEDGLVCEDCGYKLTCIDESHEALIKDIETVKDEIAAAENCEDKEEAESLREVLEQYEEQLEKVLEAKAEATVEATDLEVVDPTPPPVEQVVSPEDSEEPDKEEPTDPGMKMVPLQLAELLERLPEWLIKFLDANPEEVKDARWIMIGEGSAPEAPDKAMLATNPDNPPPSKAQEKKAAKKGLSKPEIKKRANNKASKAAADAVHKVASKGKKAAAGATA